MKTCSNCHTSKELTEFNKILSKKDGLDPYCRTCRSAYYKSRNYDRSDYQAHYKRKITDRRKQYLQEYLKEYKIEYRKRTKTEDRMYKLVRRVLGYKQKQKIHETNKNLGWSKSDFINKLGIIPDGLHLDHKIPVSWFVKDTPMRIINHLDNLHFLPPADNISKLNRFCHQVPDNFLQEAKSYLKPEYICFC